MPLLSFRQAQIWLQHSVIWVLLGVLVFTQPSGRLPAPQFYLLQAGLFVVTLGAFYLNVLWAVPRLLYGRRLLLYLAFLVVLVLGVAVPHRLTQTALERPYAQRGSFGPSGSLPVRLGARPPVRARWVHPAVLLSTLLVLVLGTSVAAVQRGQREAQIRQALEQEKLLTELSWLKAQINPHFFFNTLHNIYALTLLDGDKAREAIHRLSRMMRYVLYEAQATTVPLSQELLFVRDYIDLMQLRLTDNVQVQLDLPEPAQEAPIAPLLLLTFVENAFKHGVSALAPSRISIVVRQPTPQTLDLHVHNSIFPDRPVALDENSGIGLVNTRRRLELLYPGRHCLAISESTPDHEYHVHLTLTLLP